MPVSGNPWGVVMRADACNVLVVAPRFDSLSFWSLRTTCEVTGVKYPTAPLGLLTVAALPPSSWRIRLVDQNARAALPSAH